MTTMTHQKIATAKIENRKCPCCGRTVLVFDFLNSVTVSCPEGCRMVKANNLENAMTIWNEPRFTDK